MRNFAVILILMILFASCKTDNDLINAGEIWQKYMETNGDLDALKSIKTMYSKNVSDSRFGEIISEVNLKYPDKVKQKITYANGAIVEYILNGDIGIIKTVDGIQNMTPQDIDNFKYMAMIIPELYCDSVSLNGIERIGLNKYYILKLSTLIGDQFYYIDKSTFDLLKVVSDNYTTEIKESVIIDNLKFVKRTRGISKDKNIINSDYQDIKINIELDDKLFMLE